jgi:hypothetical protein
LWTILHRFQRLNRLPTAALLSAWDREALGQAAFDFDLRIWLPLPRSRIAACCGVDQSTLDSAVLAIDDAGAARARSATTLRFRVACLSAGFHATLHQCALIDRCPVALR